MNHAPRIQTTSRANELVEQYNRSRKAENQPTKMTSYELKLHYLAAINRARLDGFAGLAGVLVELYHKRFPNPA